MEENGKILLDKKIRQRIKDLQKGKNHSDDEIARILNLTASQYKNIVRINGGNIYIKQEVLERLAQHYDCTRDYILGKSEDPSLDENGRTIVHPFSLSEKEKMITYITDYLHNNKNMEFLRSLYLILAELPPDITRDIVNILNFIANILKTYALIDRNDNISQDKLTKLIQYYIISDNVEISGALIKLVNANEDFNKKRFRKALDQYIDIIYHQNPISWEITEEAIEKVRVLNEKWNKFPPDLSSIVTELASLKKGSVLSKEAKEIMEPYLK